jgi:hypothetical protein
LVPKVFAVRRSLRPKPLSVLDAERAASDLKVRRAVEALVAHLRDPAAPEPTLSPFSEEDLSAVYRLARRKAEHDFDEREFVRMMERTRPVVTQPRSTDGASDLWMMLAQPEMLEHWASIDPRTGARGRHPGCAAKAFLFFVATQGISSHFDANHVAFAADRGIQAVFEWVEATGAAATGRRPVPFALRSYEQTLRQMHRVAERVFVDDMIDLNVRLVREVHRLLGVEETYLGIDGMVWKAWVEQIGTQPAAREAAIRKTARSATPILIERDGWREFARGYRLVAIVDLITGLPLTWTLWPGYMDEPKALKHLLHVLYGAWPDLKANALVADAAWDEDWAAHWCLVGYGLPLVAHRHPSYRDKLHELSPFESEGISMFSGEGVVYCRRHGVPMIRDGWESAQRSSNGRALTPGEPSREAAFRIRAHCPVDPTGCGRRSLRMDHNFAALAPHPHSMDAGAVDLHALRLALFARRNANEALHSALQVGHQLGLPDAGRMRTPTEPTVEALASIAMISRTALLLAAERIRVDEFPPEPPRDLKDRLLLF